MEREKAVMVEERDKFQQQLSSQQVRRRRCRRRGAGGRRGQEEEHKGQEEGQETNGGFQAKTVPGQEADQQFCGKGAKHTGSILRNSR